MGHDLLLALLRVYFQAQDAALLVPLGMERLQFAANALPVALLSGEVLREQTQMIAQGGNAGIVRGKGAEERVVFLLRGQGLQYAGAMGDQPGLAQHDGDVQSMALRIGIDAAAVAEQHAAQGLERLADLRFIGMAQQQGQLAVGPQ